jgi:hypothetical protein
VAASEYAVKISRRDGALEVTGPDKDWVDEKIEQLGSVVSDYTPEPKREGPEDEGRSQRTTRRTAQKKGSANGEARSAAAAPRRARSRGGKPTINPDLQAALTPEVKGQLKDYISARRKAWDGSQPAQAAIIATFLQDVLDHSGVDLSDLYTVYSVMGERSPNNIRSQLINARQRARYFGGVVDGKTTLSQAGENFARYDSLDGAGDESAND